MIATIVLALLLLDSILKKGSVSKVIGQIPDPCSCKLGIRRLCVKRIVSFYKGEGEEFLFYTILEINVS